jgi:predicted porin
MKKSLLALAVLGAFATAASAQSSVTVYGKVDVGVVHDSGSVAGTNPAGSKSLRVSSGVSGGSRLGFRGVEDLGGGLKATFVAETGFCADSNAGAPNFCTGGNNFMGRQAYVGLSGGFGSLTLGRQYAPSFIVLTTVDPFGTGLAGQSTNLFDGGNGFGNPRFNNAVIYSTPSMGGFTATVNFAAGEQLGNWKAGRQIGGSAVYSAGPIYAGASYNRTETGTAAPDKKLWNVGGTWDFGVAKAHLMYQSVKNGPTAAFADERDLLGGVSARFGASTVMASYVRHDDKTALNRDANQYGVGYMYSLSKRTSVYGAVAKISNKNNATFTVGNATESGTGNRAINLGVVHNF